MQSDMYAFKACADKSIQELNNLKKTKQELDLKLRQLNARRVDAQTKRSAELQRGNDIRREVENWFDDVEKIQAEAENNERLIKLLCSPENILRIVEATSSFVENDPGNVSFFGVAGYGVTSINLSEGSNISTNIGKVETTHHHHYHEKGRN